MVEIEAEGGVHWGDIETCELSKVNLQRQIMEDIVKFHPEVEDFLKDRQVICGLPPAGINGSHASGVSSSAVEENGAISSGGGVSSSSSGGALATLPEEPASTTAATIG